jgi:hypothetical protein
MIAKISVSDSKCLISMHRTLLKNLMLMQPRYVCSLKKGYYSFSCGWMEIRFNIASYITVYVTQNKKDKCNDICQLLPQCMLHMAVKRLSFFFCVVVCSTSLFKQILAGDNSVNQQRRCSEYSVLQNILVSRWPLHISKAKEEDRYPTTGSISTILCHISAG